MTLLGYSMHGVGHRSMPGSPRASGSFSPQPDRTLTPTRGVLEADEQTLLDRLTDVASVQETSVSVAERRKRFQPRAARNDPHRRTQPITLQEILEADA